MIHVPPPGANYTKWFAKEETRIRKEAFSLALDTIKAVVCINNDLLSKRFSILIEKIRSEGP